MTLAERAKMATQARQRKAHARGSIVRREVNGGAMIKQAAYVAGVSERTAKRYLAASR